MQKMKNLVTGCACFIGSQLVDKLLDQVIGKGLGYVGLPKLFCTQKPLLKKGLRHFLLRKKRYFFGKVFKTFQKKGL
jgi:nucleoside-diphosphate-sugar epimerase